MHRDLRSSSFPYLLLALFSAIMGGLATYALLAGHPPDTLRVGAQSTGLASPVVMTSHAVQDAIVGSARKIGPSVVNIDTTIGGHSQDDDMGGQPPKGQGSGVIVSADGYVLTNYHVVQGASNIEVTLPDPDGRKFTGSLKGADRLSDLAIVKIDATLLPVAELGDSDTVPIGAFVIAVGNPFGFQHTVTMGVLSGRGREIPEPGKEFRNLLQTDAAINPGNSGGPLVDVEGRVIGINTAIIPQAQGIGFAIPINSARDIMKQLLEKGHVTRTYIGVMMMPLTPRLAEHFRIPDRTDGAVVRQVVPGSPAAQAGLRSADVIVAVDGATTKTITEVQTRIRAHKPGERVKLSIIRQAQPLEVVLEVAEMPSTLR